MSLTQDVSWQLQHRFIRGFIDWLGNASDGARVWERDGVSAAIVPASGERSIMNLVVGERAGALAGAYDDLAEAYRESGVFAWTVWIHEDDQDAHAFLKSEGHAFDGAPVAMSLELSHWEPQELSDLDWDTKATFEELGRINDLAYGYDAESGMAHGIKAPGSEIPLRLYRARAQGEVACILGTLDVEDDAGILFVATLPHAREQRLASRLLSAALEDAKGRGIKTSSLQASALGSPIYERLGYRTYFRFHAMERRLTPTA